MFAFQDTFGPVGVAFTDRAGGVSQGGFASLNLAVTSEDDPVSVGENLRRVMAAFTGDPDGALARARQVHGAEAVLVQRGAPDPLDAGALPEADALVSDVVGLTLMVGVADCVPIILADPDRGVVAAVHAGRLGVQVGVVSAAVTRMRELGAAQLTAWVGPHVCGACYEVPAAMREEVAADVPQAWSVTSWGTPALDLGAAVAAQLDHAGAVLRAVSRCTLEDERLYSHRRDPGAGRMAAMVRIEP